MGHTDDAALRTFAGKPLVAALKDNSEDGQAAAAVALRHFEDEGPLDALVIAAVEGNPKVRAQAFETLVQFGEPALEPSLTIFTESDETVRSMACWALGRLATVLDANTLRDRMVPFLVTALQDSTRNQLGEYPIRQVAATTLKRIGTLEGLAAVREVESQQRPEQVSIPGKRLRLNYGAVRESTRNLVRILEKQRSHEVVEALYRQGKHLFDERKWKEVANQLRQILPLAEQLGDEKLKRRCETYPGPPNSF